jgi:hypothetical protein
VQLDVIVAFLETTSDLTRRHMERLEQDG